MLTVREHLSWPFIDLSTFDLAILNLVSVTSGVLLLYASTSIIFGELFWQIQGASRNSRNKVLVIKFSRILSILQYRISD